MLLALVLAAAITCQSVIVDVFDLIPNESWYMETPRKGDAAKNEPSIVYAEVDYFIVTARDDGSTFFQPIYRAYSMFGLLRILNFSLPLDDPGVPATIDAMDAIISAWDEWSGGSAVKPVPYGAARMILTHAAGKCPPPE